MASEDSYGIQETFRRPSWAVSPNYGDNTSHHPAPSARHISAKLSYPGPAATRALRNAPAWIRGVRHSKHVQQKGLPQTLGPSL
jgi:hypothetical protein